jgi:hypothetical protein
MRPFYGAENEHLQRAADKRFISRSARNLLHNALLLRRMSVGIAL